MGLLLAILLSVGCSGPSRDQEASNTRAPSSTCMTPDFQEARRSLVERAGLPLSRPRPPEVVWGPESRGAGFRMQAVRWAHASVAGDHVQGLWVEPSPLPEGPLPLLLNVHGHWDGGVEADEVLFRSQLFARNGWAVLSVATRGRGRGSAEVPAWRAAHYGEGLYGELRGRRTGRTPLGWNVVAARGGLEAALSGRFSEAAIERDEVALIGISGGAEIATALAATDSRIGGLVIGSFEYAFGTEQGVASCSCGALEGGDTPGQRGAWVAQGACRPGTPPGDRPMLAWDGKPDLDLGAELIGLQPGIDRRQVAGVHGMTRAMAAASWAFLEEGVRGKTRTAADEDTARIQASEAWTALGESMRMDWAPGLPAPGWTEQGRPPWESPLGLRLPAARRLLGLEDEAGRQVDPAGGWAGLNDARISIRRARGLPDGRGWVVVEAPGPLLTSSWTPSGPEDVGDLLTRLDPSASVVVLRPRTAGGDNLDQRVSRWAVTAGQAPLGIAVRDALEAAALLGARPEVDPERIGFVGIGSGGAAALWAGLVAGPDAPVLVAGGPVTLWWDGPDRAARSAQPWPAWLLAPIPEGVALDPWFPAQELGERLTWIDPRDGGGGSWLGAPPLPGTVAGDLEEALSRRSGQESRPPG